MAPGLAPGHYRWTQTVPDLNCLAIFGPRPPQPRRAARRARSSGPTLVPSPAAPAPRSLSVFRHAGSAAHDGQASRLTHPWCRIEHVVPEEVAQVAVVVVVFPVVVLLMLSYNGRAVLAETEPHSEHGNGLVKK